MTDDGRDQESPRAGGNSGPDYERKYRGQVRKYNETAAALEVAREKLELAQAQLAERDKRLKEVEQTMAQLTSERDKALKQFQALDNRVRSIKTASEKYPHLRDAIEQGLLREPDEFDAPEGYEAYLAKVSGSFKVEQQTQQQQTPPAAPEGIQQPPATDSQPQIPSNFLPGQMPAVSARVTATTAPRAAQIIADEMSRISPIDPRWAQLEKELEAAVTSAQPTLARPSANLLRPPQG